MYTSDQSIRVIFFLLCKVLTIHKNIFDDFPKISEDFPKFVWKPGECFRTFFKDNQRLPENQKMFQS